MRRRSLRCIHRISATGHLSASVHHRTGPDGGKALDCAGKYIDSQNTRTFNQTLNKTIQTTFAKTTVSVALLNAQGQPLESNVNISFLHSTTGTSAYEFVHYIDKHGHPDSVQVDPVPSYDVVVNTLPPLVKKNITPESGKHTIISLNAPQGNLVIRSEGRGTLFNVIVREKGKHEILNQQRSGETYRYLSGTYEVETLTFPRRIFEVTIEPDKMNAIALPSPGIANINTLSQGFGSLFEIQADGREVWVCKLDETKAMHAYNLLPGAYRVAFRAKGAPGSKYTGVKTFAIVSGKTTSVSVFN